jgi:hypothetical protein
MSLAIGHFLGPTEESGRWAGVCIVLATVGGRRLPDWRRRNLDTQQLSEIPDGNRYCNVDLSKAATQQWSAFEGK